MARKLRRRLGVTAAFVVVLGAVLAYAVRPPFENTRMRNSLVARLGTPQDFEWTPAHLPQGFILDTGTIPAPFVQAAQKAHAASRPEDPSWSTALALGRHLASGPGRGSGIKKSTLAAYRIIMARKAGYCADFTQVFNGLSRAAGLAVREWGMSFDGFGGNGHAFNEIYDSTLGKWVFIDSYMSFYVEDPVTNIPLSAMEFRERLRNGRDTDQLRIVPIDRKRFAFRSAAQAIAYYGKGADQMYLWFGNNVFSYDQQPLVAFLGRYSRALEQATAIILGVHPSMMIIPSRTNASMVNWLFKKRDLFFAGTVLFLLLAVAFIVQVIRYFRLLRNLTR